MLCSTSRHCRSKHMWHSNPHRQARCPLWEVSPEAVGRLTQLAAHGRGSRAELAVLNVQGPPFVLVRPALSEDARAQPGPILLLAHTPSRRLAQEPGVPEPAQRSAHRAPGTPRLPGVHSRAGLLPGQCCRRVSLCSGHTGMEPHQPNS